MTGQIWASSPVANDGTAECGDANYCSFKRFVELSPNAVVQSVELVTGQRSSDGWKNFVGCVDDVTIGFGTATNYDLGG